MSDLRFRLMLLTALFTLTYIGVRTAASEKKYRIKDPNWNAIPYQLGDWSGQDTFFDPVYGADPAETSFLRMYSKNKQPPVIAYVGFYRDLATILDVHTPELCYPAQGWGSSVATKIDGGAFRGAFITASEITVSKGGEQRLVAWWYNAGSRPFKTRIRYIYSMLALSMFTGRRDGSIVRLETPILSGNEQAARDRMEDFRSRFLPALDRALPDSY